MNVGDAAAPDAWRAAPCLRFGSLLFEELGVCPAAQGEIADAQLLRGSGAGWFLLHSDDRWLLAKLMGTGVDMIELHYGHLIAPHANRSRAILDAIWENYLDANWTQAQNAISTAPLESLQILLNQTGNDEAL